MEENTNLIESLLEKATDYGKTSYELVKLNVIDKTTNSISSFVPNTAIFLILSIVILFLNLGLALWIGKLIGEIYFGFFIVSAFYAVLALIMYFFLRKWVKRVFHDFLIRQLLG